MKLHKISYTVTLQFFSEDASATVEHTLFSSIVAVGFPPPNYYYLPLYHYITQYNLYLTYSNFVQVKIVADSY